MVLIFGAGRIGKDIYYYLQKHGHEVKIFSKSLPNHPDRNFFKGDISNILHNPEILDNVSVIIYTIHTTVPSTSFENELFDAETNILPFINLLNLCKGRNLKKFIYISSGGAVYGNPMAVDKIKEDHPTNPISSYGITKLVNEKYLLLFKRNFSQGITILRPSNIYGTIPNLNIPQDILAKIIHAALTNTPMEVWGDGNSKKDYLNINDFLEAIEKVLLFDNVASREIFNVSSGQMYSINEIIDIVQKITEKKIKMKYSADKEFDVKNIELDNSAFCNTFFWKPHLFLELGIKKMLSK